MLQFILQSLTPWNWLINIHFDGKAIFGTCCIILQLFLQILTPWNRLINNFSVFAKSSGTFNLGFGWFVWACWGALGGRFMVIWAQIDQNFPKIPPMGVIGAQEWLQSIFRCRMHGFRGLLSLSQYHMRRVCSTQLSSARTTIGGIFEKKKKWSIWGQITMKQPPKAPQQAQQKTPEPQVEDGGP